MRIRIVVLVSLAILIAASAAVQAASGPGLWRYYVLPVAAHTQGTQGTYWRTDVSIVNVYDWQSVTVYMKFLKADQDNSSAAEHSYTLDPGASVLLEDIVFSVFGETGNGAVEFSTKDHRHFVVSARTYTGDDATYGLTQVGQEYFGHEGGMTFVSGVRENERFRGSVGAVNASYRNVQLEAYVFDFNGDLKGFKSFNLKPRSQTQVLLRTFASRFDSGYVVWRCATTDGYVTWAGYATVTDNSSGDGVFLPDRRNDQYVEYIPAYDLSGWWEGSTAGPLGTGSTWVHISQDGAELDAYDCDLSAWPGVEESYFYGYMDGDEIVIEGGWMLYPECWSDFITDGYATATASTISGSITVDGDCGSGTQTFSLVPSSRKSLPVPPRARRDRNAPHVRP